MHLRVEITSHDNNPQSKCSMKSPFYSSPALYQLLIRLLYRNFFNSRYEIIADLIPENSSVVDVCAGEAYLYTHFLRNKSIQYLGVDNSPYFVKWANDKKIPYKKLNVFKEKIPKGDYVIMMGSLFQFEQHEKEILQRMIQSASRKAIISEPINNVASSKIGFLARIANRLTVPFEAPAGYSGKRFDHSRLSELFISIPQFERSFEAPNGRELIGIFSGRGEL